MKEKSTAEELGMNQEGARQLRLANQRQEPKLPRLGVFQLEDEEGWSAGVFAPPPPSTPPERTTTNSTCAEQSYRVGDARDIRGDSIGQFEWDSGAEVPTPSSPETPRKGPTTGDTVTAKPIFISGGYAQELHAVSLELSTLLDEWFQTMQGSDEYEAARSALLALYNRQREEIEDALEIGSELNQLALKYEDQVKSLSSQLKLLKAEHLTISRSSRR